MYFSAWFFLIAFSLWLSVVAFIWGLRSGQFSDQDRARYLPLRDLRPPSPGNAGVNSTVEIYALMAIGLLLVLALTGSIVSALLG